MARVVMQESAIFYLEFAEAEFLDTKLGPLIAEDARRYAPMRTGRLKESIGWEVDGLRLYVFAKAPYAGYVEMGHRVYHPSTDTLGPDVVKPQPFLRPAIYKYRTPEMPDPPATFPTAVSHPPRERYRSIAQFTERGIRLPRDIARALGARWRRR